MFLHKKGKVNFPVYSSDAEGPEERGRLEVLGWSDNKTKHFDDHDEKMTRFSPPNNSSRENKEKNYFQKTFFP